MVFLHFHDIPDPAMGFVGDEEESLVPLLPPGTSDTPGSFLGPSIIDSTLDNHPPLDYLTEFSNGLSSSDSTSVAFDREMYTAPPQIQDGLTQSFYLFDDGYISFAFGHNSADWLLHSVFGHDLRENLCPPLPGLHPYGFHFDNTTNADRVQPHDVVLRVSSPDTHQTYAMWSNGQSSFPFPPFTAYNREVITVDYMFPFSPNFFLGPIVPQRLWKAGTKAARQRHRKDAAGKLRPPIYFVPDDCQNGLLGVTLAEAMEGVGNRLLGGHERVRMGAPSTYIRTLWPGYKASRHQVQLREDTAQKEPITLERLVKHVARALLKFFKTAERDEELPDPGEWLVGEGGIKSDDIRMIGLVHTSTGGWQPLIQVCRHSPLP